MFEKFIQFVIMKDIIAERISCDFYEYKNSLEIAERISCDFYEYKNSLEDDDPEEDDEPQKFYMNNVQHKRHYNKIKKMIVSYNKTLALLNIRNNDSSIAKVANLILHQVPYSIKYIDMTKNPIEIKYKHYDGIHKSFQ